MMTKNNAIAAIVKSRAEAEAAVPEWHGLKPACP